MLSNDDTTVYTIVYTTVLRDSIDDTVRDMYKYAPYCRCSDHRHRRITVSALAFTRGHGIIHIMMHAMEIIPRSESRGRASRSSAGASAALVLVAVRWCRNAEGCSPPCSNLIDESVARCHRRLAGITFIGRSSDLAARGHAELCLVHRAPRKHLARVAVHGESRTLPAIEAAAQPAHSLGLDYGAENGCHVDAPAAGAGMCRP